MKYNAPSTAKDMIICLSGTHCAGKDTAARHLVTEHHFMHVSTGDILRAEADNLGRDHQRQTLIDLSVEIRRDYGSLGAFVAIGLKEWQKNRAKYPGGIVFSGLRLLAEAEEILKRKGILIWIDGPPEVRYQRQIDRAESEGRAIDTRSSLAEFIAADENEMESHGDPERPNLRAIKRIAEVHIWNDFKSTSEYIEYFDKNLNLQVLRVC